MKYSDDTRRYLAKVSRIGMVAAILYALIHGFLQVFPAYGFKFRFYLLTNGSHNVIPELAVAGVGLAALLVCGVLSLILRGKPAVAQAAWIIAGKAVLLAAPVGYIRSQLLRHVTAPIQRDFLISFAILATVFVGYAWSMRPRDGLADPIGGVRPRRILRGTAIVGGIMLASLAWLLLLGWKSYSSLMESWSANMKLEYLLWMPLHTTLPVALAVTVGYPLLSLAARWDEAPSKGRFGKGTLLLGWVTLAISVWYQIMAVMIQTRILDYTAGSLMGDLQDLQNMQAMQQVIATVGTLLGIWTLCRILSRVRESKAALWGTRCVLGVIILRHLFTWIVDMIRSAIQLKNQSGMGIIGGMDYSLTVLTAKLESWANVLLTILTIAALCILTVGLTRHCRVSKAFWAVPVLTAATVGVSLLVAIIWELFLRNTSLDTLEVIRTVFLTVIPAALTVARSLMGVLILARTPAEEIPSIPTASNTEEPLKPRMEDYLYQL